MNTPCAHLTDAVAQRLAGRRPPRAGEAAPVEAHAAVCLDCAALVESYRALSLALDALPGPELPDDFTAGVLSGWRQRERTVARERRAALAVVAVRRGGPGRRAGRGRERRLGPDRRAPGRAARRHGRRPPPRRAGAAAGGGRAPPPHRWARAPPSPSPCCSLSPGSSPRRGPRPPDPENHAPPLLASPRPPRSPRRSLAAAPAPRPRTPSRPRSRSAATGRSPPASGSPVRRGHADERRAGASPTRPAGTWC